MYKISYKDLRSDQFKTTMVKLSSCTDLHHKVAYNVMRMAKSLEAKLKDSQKEWVDLTKNLIQADEQGRLKLNAEKTDFLWAEGVNPEEGKKKIEDFMAKEVIIDRVKLKIDDLAPAKLSAAELSGIEFMLVELE